MENDFSRSYPRRLHWRRIYISGNTLLECNPGVLNVTTNKKPVVSAKHFIKIRWSNFFTKERTPSLKKINSNHRRARDSKASFISKANSRASSWNRTQLKSAHSTFHAHIYSSQLTRWPRDLINIRQHEITAKRRREAQSHLWKLEK